MRSTLLGVIVYDCQGESYDLGIDDPEGLEPVVLGGPPAFEFGQIWGKRTPSIIYVHSGFGRRVCQSSVIGSHV